MNEQSSSIELVRRAKHGDDDALDRLFRRYYDRVRRIVKMRLGSKLKAKLEIEDILQDTFVTAVEAFDRFEMRDDASLINWLARLAEHKIIAAADYHSAKKRDSGREVRLHKRTYDDSSAISQELADSIDGPSTLVEQSELKGIIEDCISELSRDYRELVLLRDYAGMTWEQIAIETHRPTPEAARMMHSRAMLELAKSVQLRSGRN